VAGPTPPSDATMSFRRTTLRIRGAQPLYLVSPSQGLAPEMSPKFSVEVASRSKARRQGVQFPRPPPDPPTTTRRGFPVNPEAHVRGSAELKGRSLPCAHDFSLSYQRSPAAG
jgi:hypothetical protein